MHGSCRHVNLFVRRSCMKQTQKLGRHAKLGLLAASHKRHGLTEKDRFHVCSHDTKSTLIENQQPGFCSLLTQLRPHFSTFCQTPRWESFILLMGNIMDYKWKKMTIYITKLLPLFNNKVWPKGLAAGMALYRCQDAAPGAPPACAEAAPRPASHPHCAYSMG